MNSKKTISKIVKNKKYILSDELFKKAPVFCKSRNARDLIKNKKLTEYIFARFDNATNTWLITDGKSRKYDKVLFEKTFVDTPIPEMKQENVIIDDKNIELAPNIIQLEEHEKFKDENGNVIEIEIRGEKKVEGVYFKVKDVAAGFKMPNLLTVIIDKRKDGYIENEHYKYFNCLNLNQKTKIKKELFLTYKGFQRVIFTTNNLCAKNNIYTMKKWLDNFDKSLLKNYKVNIEDNFMQNKVGYVYIVSSNLLNAVKIGMWRSNIEALFSRYITCYGKDIHIDYYLTNDARELESKTHAQFIANKITNELFDKNNYEKYIEFIKNNVVEPDDVIENNNIENNIFEPDNVIENNNIEYYKNKIQVLEYLLLEQKR